MTTQFTDDMAWQRMMDLAVEIHRLAPVFAAAEQSGLHEDLRSASVRGLTAIARLVSGAGAELKAAPSDIRAHLRELETLGMLAAALEVLDADQAERLTGIFSDVRFLLKRLA